MMPELVRLTQTALQPHVGLFGSRSPLPLSFWSSYGHGSPLSPITPWIQPIKLKESGMYIDCLHTPVGNVLNVVLGRNQSLSKVGLQRWIIYRMRVSFLSDIELRTPARRKCSFSRQYYVEFTVGDTSRLTSTAAKTRTSWDEIFCLWVHVLSLTPEN
jgi:hypothetical protein